MCVSSDNAYLQWTASTLGTGRKCHTHRVHDSDAHITEVSYVHFVVFHALCSMTS